MDMAENRPVKKMPEEKNHLPKGFFKDEVWKKDPATGKEVLVENTGWVHNDIVEGMVKLIAALMKGEIGIHGMMYHAQGEGEPGWDIGGAPVPAWSDTALSNEYFRSVPDSIVFLDALDVPTATITNVLLVKTTLDFGDANGNDGLGRDIRCQGVFGGDATAVLDSGMMLDEINHTKRWKDATVKIVRYIKFVF